MAEVLETARLRVRELEESDLDFLVTMLGDPQTMRFWPRPYTPEEALDWLARHRAKYAEDGCGYWLLTLLDGTPIGQVGVFRQVLEWPGKQRPHYWGLGYILHWPYWSHGYATEAASACLDWIFARKTPDMVLALIRPENGPSVAVASRLGMVAEDTVPYAGFAHTIYTLRRDPDRL